MKPVVCSVACLCLCACSASSRPQGGPGAAAVGAPELPVGAATLQQAFAANVRADPEPLRLPDRITLPAVYRLILVDGHQTLVRDSDPQASDTGSPSLRIVAGEIARGEPAYQPGLLPQELSAAVTASRESTARMDAALDAVMRRSRALSEQAMEIEAQGKRLAELLAASEARVHQLEAEARPAAATPAAEPEVPKDPE